MSQVQEAISDLDRYATELDSLSNKLAEVERKFEVEEAQYEAFLEDFTAGLWDRYEEGEVKRWPGEDTRLKLARRHMESEMKLRYDVLSASRKRMIRHMAALAKAIDARRSILSAEKTLSEVG